jgi:hypothetical protein
VRPCLGIMRHILILQIILFSLLTVMSCDSTPCARTDMALTFINFTSAETDSIIIRRFNKADNGSVSLKDTVLFNGNEVGYRLGSDSLQIFSPMPETLMMSDYDYEIAVPGAARLYSLTDIQEDYENYKDKPFSCKKDLCSNRINSFKVNGTTIAGQLHDYMVYLTK